MPAARIYPCRHATAAAAAESRAASAWHPGLYFVVSFPVYLRIDEHPVDAPQKPPKPATTAAAATPLRDALCSSLASGMAVLLLLDVTRLGVAGVPLTIGGKLMEVTHGG